MDNVFQTACQFHLFTELICLGWLEICEDKACHFLYYSLQPSSDLMQYALLSTTSVKKKSEKWAQRESD